MSRPRHAAPNARRAELVRQINGPAPLNNAPQNRTQRRQAARVLQRLASAARKKGGSHE